MTGYRSTWGAPWWVEVGFLVALVLLSLCD